MNTMVATQSNVAPITERVLDHELTRIEELNITLNEVNVRLRALRERLCGPHGASETPRDEQPEASGILGRIERAQSSVQDNIVELITHVDYLETL